jgi:hypothetical protein
MFLFVNWLSVCVCVSSSRFLVSFAGGPATATVTEFILTAQHDVQTNATQWTCGDGFVVYRLPTSDRAVKRAKMSG